MNGIIAIVALIGAPIIAAIAFWRVFSGAPWRAPSDVLRFLECFMFAVIAALWMFNGWFELCERFIIK